jgi:UDP-N-acetylmuramoylalanine--D-glutamate ligase
MKIAIVGFGLQGRSAFDYWNTPDNSITICDKFLPKDLPAGVSTKADGDYLSDLHEFDLIVRTPSLHPKEILETNDLHPEVMNKVTTVTNEFFKVCPCPIIGVTGTKGKGTTSSLITMILQQAGRRVHLGGNIGTPPLDLLKNNIQPDDLVVLELANFQLIDLRFSPHIAVSLMVSPEHLDWHSSMEEYIKAKQQLFVHQNPQDLTIYNSNNLYSEEIADVSPATKIAYAVPPQGEDPDSEQGAYVKGSHIYMNGEKICSVHDTQLLGRHNLENICAAVAATWDITAHNKHAIETAIKSFKGLPHRLEPVTTKNKVTFYNDSFAANPSATIAAINAITGRKIMIIGGFERGINVSDLCAEIKNHEANIKMIVLMGESAERVANSFKALGINNFSVVSTKSLNDVVATAVKYAQPGDSIVLSPGFPSFDMFKNFEDRGNQYKAIVKAL